jgi:hypothetical protein
MTATIEIRIEDLVANVRELAASRPDNIYQPASAAPPTAPQRKCSYLTGNCHDGTVGCLLGQALLAIGFTAHQLRRIDTLSIEEALASLSEVDSGHVDGGHVAWLMAVQCGQDEGHTWRRAVELADQEEPL